MGRMRVVSAKHRCSKCDGELEFDKDAEATVPNAVYQFWCVDCGHGMQEVFCPPANAILTPNKIEIPT